MIEKTTDVLAGLGFGDEGKGTVTDYLTRALGADLVVRYNGGAQAAHNVVTPEGLHHTFCQFGSGTLAGARTLLSRHVIVNPIALVHEGDDLVAKGVPDALGRVSVDARALVITPYHVVANRAREIARGDGRHGTCGQGVGETVADSLGEDVPVLRVADLRRPNLPELLAAVRRAKIAQIGHLLPAASDALDPVDLETIESDRHLGAFLSWIRYFNESVSVLDARRSASLLRGARRVVFEGAQGVLLHEAAGFYPHVTWTDTSFANADHLLAESGRPGAVRRMGIFRAYATRHGDGPFVTEEPALSAAIPDPHNGDHRWQRAFRVGWFDLVAARYALDVVGRVDSLAFTCLDRLEAAPTPWKTCVAYRSEPGSTAGLDCRGSRGSRSRARRLEVSRPFDIERQAELSKTLARCAPVYQESDARRPDRYVAALGRALGVPVSVLSRGPGAESKRLTLAGRELLSV